MAGDILNTQVFSFTSGGGGGGGGWGGNASYTYLVSRMVVIHKINNSETH